METTGDACFTVAGAAHVVPAILSSRLAPCFPFNCGHGHVRVHQNPAIVRPAPVCSNCRMPERDQGVVKFAFPRYSAATMSDCVTMPTRRRWSSTIGMWCMPESDKGCTSSTM